MIKFALHVYVFSRCPSFVSITLIENVCSCELGPGWVQPRGLPASGWQQMVRGQTPCFQAVCAHLGELCCKQQKRIVSQSWRPEVHDPGLGMVSFS